MKITAIRANVVGVERNRNRKTHNVINRITYLARSHTLNKTLKVKTIENQESLCKDQSYAKTKARNKKKTPTSNNNHRLI